VGDGGEREASVNVGDVMSTEVMTIGVEAPLKEAATVMVKTGVSGLPVVDDDRKVVGIVTEADFVAAEADRSWGRQRRRLLASFFGASEPQVARTVGEAMTRNPHTIDSGSSVAEAARKMADLRVKRLPVVTPDGTLSGIISRADVMGVFARPDAELAEEITSSVVVGILSLSPDEVSVSVVDGVASLEGHVESRTESRLLEELTQRIEGVVAVTADVTWSHDDRRSGSTDGL
jgi:CBS domain-containing protein